MSKFTINDGILKTKQGSIALSDVDYLVPRKGLLLGQYIFIGSRNGSYVKVRVSDKEIERILSELKAVNAPIAYNFDNLIEFNEAVGALKSGKSKRMNSNNAWLTDDVVIYVPDRRILATDSNPVCISVKDVVFSTTERVLKFGFLPSGYRTYFGSAHDQAFFYHPEQAHGDKLNQHLIDNGSVIGTEASETFNDCFWLGKLFSPFKFRKHEEIGFSDDAIIYKYKKGSSVETVYLPYDQISYLDIEKGFFHSNYISIFGQQNIMTHLQFSNKAIKAIKKILIDKHIPAASKIIRPRMMLGLLPNPFAKRTLAVFSDKLIFTDSKAKTGITLPIDQIDYIVWKKKYFFYFVGYLFVSGGISNIRRDQSGGSETIGMPKIWASKKNLVKKMVSGVHYNKRDDKKMHSIEEITYS